MNSEALAPGIVMYKNVVQDSELLLELIKQMDHSWRPGEVAQSRVASGDYSSGKDIRDVSVISLPHEVQIAEDPILKRVREILKNSFYLPEQEYSKAFSVIPNIHESYQIVRYEVGQYFKEHSDATKEFSRKVSLVYYLNDDYLGGEIYFPNFNLKIKPEKNSLLMFPSSDNYKHSANTIEKGTKYAIVGFWH
jgi:hypothetical protein